MKITKKKILLTFFIILTFIIGISIGKNAGKKPVKKRKAKIFKQVPVEVIKVKSSKVKERIFLTGEIRGIEEVRIFSFVTGVLRRKFVTEGQHVRKGQAIFAIDQTQRGLDILDHIVRSPINGIVSDIKLDIGDQVVTNQTVIASVVQAHQVKVKVSIGMQHLGDVKIGNTAIIKVSTHGSKEFRGTIRKISPTVDPNNRTVEAEVIIDNRNKLLKSGMFAEVIIVTSGNKNKILLPQQCVLFEDNVNYVFMLDKTRKKAIKKIIRTGYNYSGRIEILKGLKGGEFVFTKGQYNVFSGFPVKVINTQVLN